ncbi:MAG: FCD domain-containing protein [Microvirga sp.]|nr:FCD domain-containing protein [Microvirga sp.]
MDFREAQDDVRVGQSATSGDRRDSGSVDLIETRLVDLLARPGMLPGVRLPTERALSEEFGVSRNVVRRAFARLEARNEVVRIIGSGTYVAERPADEARARASGSSDYSPREIMQARMMIEPRFAALIVMNANGADMDAIGEAMREAERAETFATFEHWDGRFHQILADATHNRLIIDIYEIITRSRETVEWGELKKQSLTPERRGNYQTEHRAIWEALHGRNAQLAEVAIRAHLVSVQENLLGA